MTPSNIFVTGATGFVGRTLCRHLISEDYTVQGAVRSAQSQARLVPGVIPFICGDLQKNVGWSSALENTDAVIHLAARVHVLKETEDDAAKAFQQLNVNVTRDLAMASAQCGVRRFIFLSSVKVNGEHTTKPFCEEDPADPQDFYGISKHEAEQTLLRLSRESRLECVILRPPLVYGEEVRANFLRLMQLVRTGIPLPLASIKNQRSLIYAGNLVSAMAACIHHPDAAGQTFFVSDGKDLSTPELIQRIAVGLKKSNRLFPFPIDILKVIAKTVGVKATLMRLTESLSVDSSKIRNTINWQPPFTVDQGINRTTRWFKRSENLTDHESLLRTP